MVKQYETFGNIAIGCGSFLSFKMALEHSLREYQSFASLNASILHSPLKIQGTSPREAETTIYGRIDRILLRGLPVLLWNFLLFQHYAKIFLTDGSPNSPQENLGKSRQSRCISEFARKG